MPTPVLASAPSRQENTFVSASRVELVNQHDQSQWEQYSINAVQAISKQLQPNPPPLMELVTFAGKIRQEIAQTEKHNKEERRHRYGKPRLDEKSYYELFTAEGCFKHLHGVIEQHISKELAKLRALSDDERAKMGISYQTEVVTDARSEDVQHLVVSSTTPRHSLGASYKTETGPDGSPSAPDFAAYFSYPSINKYDWNEESFPKSHQYYQALTALSVSAENLHEYLDLQARFAYNAARDLFTSKGNASIVNWIIYGVAKAKGMKLGPYNQADFDWDVRALITFSEDDYAAWYVENAFKYVYFQPEPQAQTGYASGDYQHVSWFRPVATSMPDQATAGEIASPVCLPRAP